MNTPLTVEVLLGAGLAAVAAALGTWLLVPVAEVVSRLVANALASVSRRPPGHVPRLGGIAVMGGIAVGGGLALVAGWQMWGRAIPDSAHAALVATTGLVFLVGLVDDLLDISPLRKLGGQLLAAVVLVAAGWRFEVLSLPWAGTVELDGWSWPLSVLWLVGVTNAMNLIDGLDGLASGLVAIIASSLLVLALVQGNPGTVVLLAATAGACLAFLRHNWQPARIYLGDSGSLSLGFLLAATSLLSSLKAQAAVAILVPVLALGLPVLDMLLVMIFRFFEGKGRPLAQRIVSVLRGDRRHLHHLLEPVVRSRRAVVSVLYSLAILFCGAAIYVALASNREAGWILLAVELIAILVLRRAGLKVLAGEMARQAKGQVAEKWRSATGG